MLSGTSLKSGFDCSTTPLAPRSSFKITESHTRIRLLVHDSNGKRSQGTELKSRVTSSPEFKTFNVVNRCIQNDIRAGLVFLRGIFPNAQRLSVIP
eukprot:scaffold13889_cov178-Amphora_coffeaeformis.AAC.12